MGGGESFLKQPNTEKHDFKGKDQRLRYACSEMQGWRNSMEDSHISELNINNDGVSLFGVFDGHGGQEVALYVKKHFVNILISQDSYQNEDYEQALIDSFIKIDLVMRTEEGYLELQGLMDQGDLSMAGCTATVALVTQTEIFVANAGDSRTVVSINGKAKNLSEDHKPNLPYERQRIEKSGGFVQMNRVKGQLALSRALGDFEYKKEPPSMAKAEWYLNYQMVTCYPDVTVQKITKDVKFLVLACDGIWDCKSSQQVVDHYSNSLQLMDFTKLEKTNHVLMNNICPHSFPMTGLGTDNMTVMVVEFLENKKSY